MSRDEVMTRSLRAKGWRGAELEAQRAALRARIEAGGPALVELVGWLEEEVAFCLDSHGDAFGGAR